MFSKLLPHVSRSDDTRLHVMNTTTNETLGIELEEPREKSENEMMFVFLGVVTTTTVLLILGTLYARKKDHREEKMVRIVKKERSFSLIIYRIQNQKDSLNQSSPCSLLNPTYSQTRWRFSIFQYQHSTMKRKV